jgi:hypothetical protein
MPPFGRLSIVGFTCMIAEDACATKDLTFKSEIIHASKVHASFMAALSGPYANVHSTTAILENSV